MKVTPYPHACIYEFTCSLDLVDRVREKIIASQLNYDVDYGDRNPTKLAKFSDEECDRFVLQCLTKVSKIHFPNLQLGITDCWVHKSEFNTNLRKHNHNNSVLSAILYLTDHPDTKVNFFIPDIISQKYDVIFGRYLEHVLSFEATKGKLIIFDSNLYHSVDSHKNISDGYALAFNSFFQGQLNVTLKGLQTKRDNLNIQLK